MPHSQSGGTPFVVEGECLTFAWVLDSADGIGMQSAYRIEMREFGKQGWIPFWDSGVVEGVDSVGIPYRGPALVPRILYDWRVMVRGEALRWSDWSAPNRLVGGLGASWSAEPIWASWDTDTVCLRREISCRGDRPLVAAYVFATGRDTQATRQHVFMLWLDGTLVGTGPARGCSGELPYSMFDVTALVVGKPCLCLSALCVSRGTLRDFSGELLMVYGDGSHESVITDQRWSVLDGQPIVGMGPPYRHFYQAGPEHWNLELEPVGWHTCAFDGSGWDAAQSLNRYTMPLVGQPVLPVTYIPVAPCARHNVDGLGEVLDFGCTHVGSLQVSFHAESPGQATVLASEELDATTGAPLFETRTKVVYLERWKFGDGYSQGMNFGYRGFRYAMVVHDKAVQVRVNSMALRYPQAGPTARFESCDPVLDRVWKFCADSALAVNIDLYQDCPTRERGAYEGDSHVQMLSHFNVEAEFSLARHTMGYLLDHPEWPMEYGLSMPAMARLYQMYSGDTAAVGKWWSALRRKPLPCLLPNGLYDTTDSASKRVMVDWPAVYRDGYEFGPCNTVAECFQYHALMNLAELAADLGHTGDAARFRLEAARLRDAVETWLFDTASGLYVDSLASGHSSLHANLFALAFGLATGPKAAGIGAYVASKGMVCSPYVAQFLLEALFKVGRAKDAIDLMVARTMHSWNHMMDSLSATVVTEAWDPSEKPNMSNAHPWSSAPANIIPRCLFGIRPTATGFSEVSICPAVGDLDWARLELPSVRGLLTVEFKRRDGLLDVRCSIPANMRATLSAAQSQSAFKLGPGDHSVVLPYS